VTLWCARRRQKSILLFGICRLIWRHRKPLNQCPLLWPCSGGWCRMSKRRGRAPQATLAFCFVGQSVQIAKPCGVAGADGALRGRAKTCARRRSRITAKDGGVCGRSRRPNGPLDSVTIKTATRARADRTAPLLIISSLGSSVGSLDRPQPCRASRSHRIWRSTLRHRLRRIVDHCSRVPSGTTAASRRTHSFAAGARHPERDQDEPGRKIVRRWRQDVRTRVSRGAKASRSQG
jgi:hypothetical protein